MPIIAGFAALPTASFNCPSTSNFAVGPAVPIPTLPLPAIYKLLADDPLFTTRAALLPMVNPPVMVDVAVVLVTFNLLIQAVSETVR